MLGSSHSSELSPQAAGTTSEETSQQNTVEEKSSLLKRLEEAVGSKAVDHHCLNEEGESHNVISAFTKKQKFWDQLDEYDSQELHCVMLTSETTKVRRSEQFKSKVLISAVLAL